MKNVIASGFVKAVLPVCIACGFAAAHAETPITLVNAGFENNWTGTNDPGYPLYESGYVAGPTGPDVGWTFHHGANGDTGVTNSNTLWGGTAFQGSRFAWIQESGATDPFGANGAYIAQSFSTTASGALDLTFELANRVAYSSGSPSVVDVALDGTIVGSFTASSASWTEETLLLPSVSAGEHSIAFAGATAAANTSSFLDDVALQTAPIPEPASALLMLAGLGLVARLSRKGRSPTIPA